MTWRDSYRDASFRGVAFFVDTASSAHGRRQAVHETAQRDTPYTEDMGRKAREFSITGYLLGKEYHTQRDDMIKACEVAGPGHLVHPYRGELTVVCRGLNVEERSAEGGYCVLSFTFLESGEASFPSVKVDTVNAIATKANTVTVEAEQGFIRKFATSGFPSFVAEAASTRLAELGAFLSAPGYNVAGDLEAASELYYSARGLSSDALALVQQPLSLAAKVTDMMSSVRAAFGSNALSVLTSIYERYSAVFVGSSATASRTQQATNFTAMNTLVRQSALAEAAKAAVITDVVETTATGSTLVRTAPTAYESYQAAVETRDALTDRLDAEAESAQDDSAYVALTDLRAAVVQAVPSPEQDLPRLVQYRPRETLPSLLLAYQVYGSAARADEISSRNSIRHPGFVTGGAPLEVLADG